MKKKRILVPVDFSQHSEYALEVAAALAKKKDSEIIVLHMLGLSEAMFTKDEAQEFMEATYFMRLAKKRFGTFLDKPYLDGIVVKEMIQNYKVFGEINQVAQEQDAYLIVMGSHGTAGLSEIFVGSNTEKVVRTSEVPVLVVKERKPNFEIKKMVFASDFKNKGLLTFREAKRFADYFGAEFHPIFINLPGDNYLSTKDADHRINGFLEKLALKMPVNIYNDYSVEKGVLNYGQEINADVVGVATHGRKGLAHFFMGSIAEDMANHSNTPVITFKI